MILKIYVRRHVRNGKNIGVKRAIIRCPNCDVIHDRIVTRITDIGRQEYCSMACKKAKVKVTDWVMSAYNNDYLPKRWSCKRIKDAKVYDVKDVQYPFTFDTAKNKEP